MDARASSPLTDVQDLAVRVRLERRELGCLAAAGALAAVHDVYEGQAKNAARNFKVDAARTFWDFDGYKKLIDSGVDIVILGTPPGFRPEHFEAVDVG